jgi:hypothetical protein
MIRSPYWKLTLPATADTESQVVRTVNLMCMAALDLSTTDNTVTSQRSAGALRVWIRSMQCLMWNVLRDGVTTKDHWVAVMGFLSRSARSKAPIWLLAENIAENHQKTSHVRRLFETYNCEAMFALPWDELFDESDHVNAADDDGKDNSKKEAYRRTPSAMRSAATDLVRLSQQRLLRRFADRKGVYIYKKFVYLEPTEDIMSDCCMLWCARIWRRRVCKMALVMSAHIRSEGIRSPELEPLLEMTRDVLFDLHRWYSAENNPLAEFNMTDAPITDLHRELRLSSVQAVFKERRDIFPPCMRVFLDKIDKGVHLRHTERFWVMNFAHTIGRSSVEKQNMRAYIVNALSVAAQRTAETQSDAKQRTSELANMNKSFVAPKKTYGCACIGTLAQGFCPMQALQLKQQEQADADQKQAETGEAQPQIPPIPYTEDIEDLVRVYGAREKDAQSARAKLTGGHYMLACAHVSNVPAYKLTPVAFVTHRTAPPPSSSTSSTSSVSNAKTYSVFTSRPPAMSAAAAMALSTPSSTSSSSQQQQQKVGTRSSVANVHVYSKQAAPLSSSFSSNAAAPSFKRTAAPIIRYTPQVAALFNDSNWNSVKTGTDMETDDDAEERKVAATPPRSSVSGGHSATSVRTQWLDALDYDEEDINNVYLAASPATTTTSAAAVPRTKWLSDDEDEEEEEEIVKRDHTTLSVHSSVAYSYASSTSSSSTTTMTAASQSYLSAFDEYDDADIVMAFTHATGNDTSTSACDDDDSDYLDL